VSAEPHNEALQIVEPWLRQNLLSAAADRPLIVGICGAQGSGKSTLSDALKKRLDADGIATVSLSLDDFYLPRAEREQLAVDVHPLMRSRGVPGTHDVGSALRVLEALAESGAVSIPRFDKSVDDRMPRDRWDVVQAPVRVILFEGWCVGAKPQTAQDLAQPVNALEANDDADGSWRRYVNAQLAGPYQQLFGVLDRLVLLAAPGFDVVHGWRLQQEEALRRRVGNDAAGLMDAAQIARFIQHYERITRHILAEMPTRADRVLQLTPQRGVARQDRVDPDAARSQSSG
jgi:D-glycerate 3-kinase